MCYPDVVPIYDGYAVRALQVISRLVPLNLTEQRQWPDGLEKYAPYLEIWIQLYAKAAPVISEAAADYLHRVRIFDKMLWLIGKRTYGVA